MLWDEEPCDVFCHCSKCMAERERIKGKNKKRFRKVMRNYYKKYKEN